MIWLRFCLMMIVILHSIAVDCLPIASSPVNYLSTGRPQLHFSVPYGWMNDPNGFVEKDGKCHLFRFYRLASCPLVHPPSSPAAWNRSIRFNCANWFVGQKLKTSVRSTHGVWERWRQARARNQTRFVEIFLCLYNRALSQVLSTVRTARLATSISKLKCFRLSKILVCLSLSLASSSILVLHTDSERHHRTSKAYTSKRPAGQLYDFSEISENACKPFFSVAFISLIRLPFSPSSARPLPAARITFRSDVKRANDCTIFLHLRK